MLAWVWLHERGGGLHAEGVLVVNVRTGKRTLAIRPEAIAGDGMLRVDEVAVHPQGIACVFHERQGRTSRDRLALVDGRDPARVRVTDAHGGDGIFPLVAGLEGFASGGRDGTIEVHRTRDVLTR